MLKSPRVEKLVVDALMQKKPISKLCGELERLAAELEAENIELLAMIDKMKLCENCKHNKGDECLDPNLTEKTHNEYCNGCEHWRPRDAT